MHGHLNIKFDVHITRTVAKLLKFEVRRVSWWNLSIPPPGRTRTVPLAAAIKQEVREESIHAVNGKQPVIWLLNFKIWGSPYMTLHQPGVNADSPNTLAFFFFLNPELTNAKTLFAGHRKAQSPSKWFFMTIQISPCCRKGWTKGAGTRDIGC